MKAKEQKLYGFFYSSKQFEMVTDQGRPTREVACSFDGAPVAWHHYTEMIEDPGKSRWEDAVQITKGYPGRTRIRINGVEQNA